MEPILVLPSAHYKDSFLEALKEVDPTKSTSTIDGNRFAGDFDAFLKIQEDEREGKNLPEGKVAHTSYWLVDGDRFIGRIDIRHKLNDALMHIGGHIGYAIRPSEREKGYGSLILKLALPKAKALGIDKALLTCKEENTSSKKIIEKNGGIFENKVLADDGTPSLRYWITIA